MESNAWGDHVVDSGSAWISPTKFEGKLVLRACITSHFTRTQDIVALVDQLERVRLMKRR